MTIQERATGVLGGLCMRSMRTGCANAVGVG